MVFAAASFIPLQFYSRQLCLAASHSTIYRVQCFHIILDCIDSKFIKWFPKYKCNKK